MAQPGEYEVDDTSRQQYWEELSEHEPEYLIEEYKEIGEEVRYRDGLMHNSYYLIAIALVFFLGNIISWTNGTTSKILYEFPEFTFLFGATSGVLLIFIAMVMRAYNKKRVLAEYRRRDIEEALNRRFDNENIDASIFGIQQEVLVEEVSRYRDDSDSSPIMSLIDGLANVNIGQYSVWLAKTGVLFILLSVVSFLVMVS